jgi:hypothetical protein
LARRFNLYFGIKKVDEVIKDWYNKIMKKVIALLALIFGGCMYTNDVQIAQDNNLIVAAGNIGKDRRAIFSGGEVRPLNTEELNIAYSVNECIRMEKGITADTNFDEINIVYSYNNSDFELQGLYFDRQKLIVINNELQKFNQETTLIHELLHWHQKNKTGLNNKEVHPKELFYGQNSLLNKCIIHWITTSK